MTTIDREPRRDIVPNGEVRAALPIGIDVIGRAANALILGLGACPPETGTVFQLATSPQRGSSGNAPADPPKTDIPVSDVGRILGWDLRAIAIACI